MTLIRFALFFLALTGIFIAGALFFRRPFFKNRSISVFIFLFSAQILDFLYSTSKVLLLYPHFIGLFLFPSGFLYGPLFYFHIRSFNDEVSGFKWYDAFHFIPFFLMIFLLRDVYGLQDGLSRAQLMWDQFIPRFLYYNYAIALHIAFYGAMIILRLKSFFRRLNSSDSGYIVAISTIYIVSMILQLGYVEFAQSWRDFAPYYLIISIYFLLVGYLLYTNPKFLAAIGGKYFSSNLSEQEMKIIISKMDDLFEGEKMYLSRTLSLSQVAEKLDIPSYKISQSLSTYLLSNFNDYVNKYRIRYAEELLKSPEFKHFKIEAIAIDSGFNNKVTFYKAFTALHNMTPSTFRKSHS